MTYQDKILCDYRSIYEDAGHLAQRLKIINEKLTLLPQESTVLTECNYLRGCLFFDFGAYADAKHYLEMSQAHRECMERWMQLKIQELILACDLNLGNASAKLDEFMTAFDRTEEEDRVFPLELRASTGCIEDVEMRARVIRWLNEKSL